jgi:hypothetical protein
MRQKVESTGGFKVLSVNGDGLGLLKTIKDLVYNFQSQKYLPARWFYLCQQGRNMTTQVYLDWFQNTVDVIHHSGGIIGKHLGIEKAIITKKGLTPTLMTNVEKKEVKDEAQG